MSTLSPNAEPMRRHRQRHRDGMRCLQLEIRETDELIRRKLLKEETRNDKQAIIDALYEFLENSLD
jgi:hypothetical protein